MLEGSKLYKAFKTKTRNKDQSTRLPAGIQTIKLGAPFEELTLAAPK